MSSTHTRLDRIIELITFSNVLYCESVTDIRFFLLVLVTHLSFPVSHTRCSRQARTQDFAQEGATCSQRGLQVTRGPQAITGSRLPGPPRRSGAQKTGCPRMTAEAHWVPRGPSGNQGHMNGTFDINFIPSKRFVQC